MIKLTDLLDLNNMKYSDEVKPKHQKKMDLQLELVGEVVIPLKPFSENSSKETRNELEWLSDYNGGIIDNGYVKKGDDVIKVFQEYCKDNNLEFDKKYYDQILKDHGGNTVRDLLTSSENMLN